MHRQILMAAAAMVVVAAAPEFAARGDDRSHGGGAVLLAGCGGSYALSAVASTRVDTVFPGAGSLRVKVIDRGGVSMLPLWKSENRFVPG